MTRPLAAAAAVLVSSALWISYGTFDPWALGMASAGALAAVAAMSARGGGEPEDRRHRMATRAILGAGVAAGFACQIQSIHLDPRTAHHPYLVSLTWTAVAIALTYGLPRPHRLVERWRFPLLVLVFAAEVVVTFRYYRLPLVDVWLFRESGAQALAHGANPYELFFQNIYGHDRFYGPGFLQDGRVVVYPYPPLTALLDVPAEILLGDVRWLCVAAVIASAAFVSRLGERPTAELAALLVLFQPRTLYVAKVSWTEPVVLAAASAVLLALRRWSSRAPAGWGAAGAAFGLLLASKQYAPLLALPLALAAPRGGRRKAGLLAVGLVAATVAPFALWNARELWRDVVVAQFLQPFRMDALSWLVAWARWRGGTPSAAIGFAAAGLALAAGLRGPVSPRRAAATAGAAFLLLLLFNKQAFCNYYWLAAGLLASASAVDDAAPERRPTEPGA